MKKRLAYFAASFIFALALMFHFSFNSSARTQSCNGKCNRAMNACLATADSTSQRAECNKAYQGCISSCK